MPDPFSREVHHVLGAAHRLAARHRHQDVRPAHVLCALIGEGRGGAIDLLKAAGIQAAQLHVKMEQLLSARRHDLRPGQMPRLHPITRQVILNAAAEAERLHIEQAGTEQLLIAITMAASSGAAHVLQQLGLDLPKARYTYHQLRRSAAPAAPAMTA